MKNYEKVNDSVKSDFNTLKHAVNEIESTLRQVFKYRYLIGSHNEKFETLLSAPLNNQLQYDNGNQYQVRTISIFQISYP